MEFIPLSMEAVLTTNGWLTAPGMNACDSRCDARADHPGLHFVGFMGNASACEATCLKANCGIWLYSSGSKACWWRTDSKWELSPQSGIVSACREVSAPGQKCIPGCGRCGAVPTPPLTPSNQSNMNGDYILSATPLGKDTRRLYPTQFREYPRDVYSFDVYSPLFSQLYSQVWWKGLDPVDLPEEVVDHFAGKGMAVVGFEMDQVNPPPPPTTTTTTLS